MLTIRWAFRLVVDDGTATRSYTMSDEREWPSSTRALRLEKTETERPRGQTLPPIHATCLPAKAPNHPAGAALASIS